MDNNKKTGWKNQVSTTLPPKYKALVEGEAKTTGDSESKIIAEGVKLRYDTMSDALKQQFLNNSKNHY